MGYDIQAIYEVKNVSTNKWERVEMELNSFFIRRYSIFAFIAGWCNDDNCEPISKAKGFPNDSSYEATVEYEDAYYSRFKSFLTLEELLKFDYDKTFLKNEEDGPTLISYRENLGERFFSDLEELKTLGDPENVRIIFWFE